MSTASTTPFSGASGKSGPDRAAGVWSCDPRARLIRRDFSAGGSRRPNPIANLRKGDHFFQRWFTRTFQGAGLTASNTSWNTKPRTVPMTDPRTSVTRPSGVSSEPITVDPDPGLMCARERRIPTNGPGPANSPRLPPPRCCAFPRTRSY